MSVSLTAILIIAAIELAIELIIEWLVDLFEWGGETLPPPNINDILAENYKPEECDVKMKNDCSAMLEEFFDEPKDQPIYVRINEKMKGMSVEEKQKLLKKITERASTVMNVHLDSIEFSNVSSMGLYNNQKNGIVISTAYMELDNCNVELVKTIFHELKHAVQFKAISTDGNIWGYSDETLIAWANNFQDYTNYYWDIEGYYHQPLELDSFGFECSVIPQPGAEIPQNNVA